MRIGLVGPMANNMYCLAKVLRKRGHEAFYVDDRSDLYPMSQPVWEDAEVELDWTRFGSEPLDQVGWRNIAERSGWNPPDWIVPVGGRRRRRTPLAGLQRSAPLILGLSWRSARLA